MRHIMLHYSTVDGLKINTNLIKAIPLCILLWKIWLVVAVKDLFYGFDFRLTILRRLLQIQQTITCNLLHPYVFTSLAVFRVPTIRMKVTGLGSKCNVCQDLLDQKNKNLVLFRRNHGIKVFVSMLTFCQTVLS